jgi:hypothetical protein
MIIKPCVPIRLFLPIISAFAGYFRISDIVHVHPMLLRHEYQRALCSCVSGPTLCSYANIRFGPSPGVPLVTPPLSTAPRGTPEEVQNRLLVYEYSFVPLTQHGSPAKSNSCSPSPPKISPPLHIRAQSGVDLSATESITHVVNHLVHRHPPLLVHRDGVCQSYGQL